MSEIIEDKDAILLGAAEKYVALSVTVSQNIVEGKQSKKEYAQGLQILTLFRAYYNHADLSTDHIETILYSLKQIAELEDDLATVSPFIGQRITYLLEDIASSVDTSIIYQSNSVDVTTRARLNFYNGLEVTDDGAILNVGINGTLSKNSSLILSAFGFTFDATGAGDLVINLGLDAAGDMYYRNASGKVARIPGGVDGQYLKYVAGVPTWAAGISYTDENAQDAVGGIFQDSDNISLTYNDGGPFISADLIDSGVTPDTYNNVFVDAKGRVTSGSNVDYRLTTDVVPLLYGGTGVALADPGADVLMFWDDSAGQVAWLTLGTNLSITGTTLNASGGGSIGGSTGATDNAVLRADGAGGSTLQNSYIIIDDFGNLDIFGNGGTVPSGLAQVRLEVGESNISNDVLTAARFYHDGGEGTGVGVGIEFAVRTSTGNDEIGALISAVTTDVGAGTEAFDLLFSIMSAGAAAAEQFRISSIGRLSSRIGTSSSFGKISNVIKTDTTTTGNVGPGEDVLQTYTLPANALSSNGDTITGTCAGSFASNVNTKRVRLKFGAYTIFDSGTMTVTAAIDWVLVFEVIRTGATTQKCAIRFICSDHTYPPTTEHSIAEYLTAGETLSGAVVIEVTGTGAADNDIVKEMFKLRWEPSE